MYILVLMHIYVCIFPYVHTMVFIKHLKKNRGIQRLKYVQINPLQGTNISHLEKRKIIFKMALKGDMLVPRRVNI